MYNKFKIVTFLLILFPSLSFAYATYTILNGIQIKNNSSYTIGVGNSIGYPNCLKPVPTYFDQGNNTVIKPGESQSRDVYADLNENSSCMDFNAQTNYITIQFYVDGKLVGGYRYVTWRASGGLQYPSINPGYDCYANYPLTIIPGYYSSGIITSPVEGANDQAVLTFEDSESPGSTTQCSMH